MPAKQKAATAKPREGTMMRLPRDIVRMAKIIGSIRGQTVVGVLDEFLREGLTQEFKRVVKSA